MSGQKGLLLVAIFLLSLSLAPVSRAQDEDDFTQDQLSDVISHARIVRLSHIQGTVQLDSDRGFENATVNTPLAEGDRLLARSDGWAEIQFEDGSTIRLAPDTQITFAQLGLNADGGTVTAIDLDQGEAEFTIQKHDNSDFAVTARNKTILLKHSGRFRVTSTNSNPLEIAVWKGEVTVSDSATGSRVAVRKNEDFSLDPFDFDKYDLEHEVLADELDNWSQQRDDDLRTYASADGNYAQSPYEYGVSDLNYYGTYYNVPGYGYLWQPAGINWGWDPFTNGYWTWSPIYGYCWVSSYPWGWMPYRYGRWIWINGRGWMWQPGYWHGWRPSPRLWNTPPGFHPPAPPTGSRVAGRPGPPPPLGNRPVPGTAGNPPPTGNRPVPGSGGLQVPRIDAQRGHRVFTNEEIQDRVPRRDVAGAPGAAVRMDRRDQAAPDGAVRMERRDQATQPSAAGTVPARPGTPAVPATGSRPAPSAPEASVPKQPAPPAQPAPAAPVVSRPEVPHTEAPRAQVPRTEAPAAPVVREHPAPSAPRVSPPPAPRVEPAPAPHVSSPPPAPHVSSPPPAPHVDSDRGSRPAETRSPDRPK